VVTRHHFKTVKHRSIQGNTFVDYMMISLVVAGIGVPLVMKYFGEPIRKTLFEQRRSLVDFVAQTPKRAVPNIWFARERLARITDPGKLGEPGQVRVNEPGTPRAIDEPSSLKDPNVKDPGQLRVGTVSEPGKLEVGDVGSDAGT
jgi:hypothetical protein